MVDEHILVAAADAVRSGVAIVDRDGGILWANLAFGSLLNLSDKTVWQNKSITEVLDSPSSENIDQSTILNGLAAMKEFRLEWGIPKGNGTQVWVELQGYPMRHSEGFGEYILTLEDISQRRRYQNQLRESQSRFRMLSNNSAAMMWTTNADALVTFVNKAWCDYTGRPMDAELGFGWTESLHPDEKDHILLELEKVFDTKKPFEVEYRVRKANGSYGWVLERGIPMFEANDVFVGIMGTCFEITDRKATEMELSRKSRTLDAVESTYNSTFKNQIGQLEAEVRNVESNGDANLNGIVASLEALKNTYMALEQELNVKKAEEFNSYTIPLPRFIFMGK
ncbi:MAG: PAS domain-containing protein [Bacteroidota bacterium]